MMVPTNSRRPTLGFRLALRLAIRVPLSVALVGACGGARPDASPSTPDVGPGSTSAGSDAAPAAPGRLVVIEPRELSLSSGAIEDDGPGRFVIRSPVLRAELGRSPRSAAELSFVYRGPTHSDAPLASGELRRQIGLKLRAQDSCNVVYVMWHIEPATGIVVSVKSNPGQSRHAECGDRGYRFLEPSTSARAATVEPGTAHVLGAEMRGRQLLVKTDGSESWVGELPAAAFSFDGPIGVRSDNGEFSVELRAEPRVQN
jgi:hypothetical protein